jgi:hypothetical protein
MYDTAVVSERKIEAIINNLEPRKFQGIVVDSKGLALEKIKELIPAGASVMNGASKTLEQIGYIDYLKSGQHPWKNLHEGILDEKDPAKRESLRKQGILSDYYLGSVHALTEEGEMIIASNTGSQLPHIAFTSPNLILVVGIQKIVPNLKAAYERLVTYVVPKEDQRMMDAYNMHTAHAKTLIYHREAPYSKRNVKVIIVKEPLGF